MKPTVVLLPGFGGRADQPILVKLERALGTRVESIRLAPPRLPLTPDLEAYVSWLSEQTKTIAGPLVMIGRSFGGRLAVRLAAQRPLAAVVLLGFPIQSQKQQARPLDARALSVVGCPLFLGQGSADPLAPLPLIRKHLPKHEQVSLHVVEGAGHSYGRHEKEVVSAAVSWLDRVLAAK